MKLRCPSCGHAAGMIEFSNEESARQAVYLASDLPKPLGRLVMRYVGLFRPAARSLSWDRTLKLMQQIKVDIDAGRIERHGRIWPAPEGLWHKAITSVLEKAETQTLTLPLKNHGYLYEIISAEQNAIEAHHEQKKETQRQQKTQVNNPQKAAPQLSVEDHQVGNHEMSEIFAIVNKKRNTKTKT